MTGAGNGLLRGHGPQGLRRGPDPRGTRRAASPASSSSRRASRSSRPSRASRSPAVWRSRWPATCSSQRAGAKLGIPEVKRSLIAAGGALRRLPRRVPPGIAKELALTGDPISAERGYDIGLVNRLTEPGEALAGALALAGEIAGNGPLALAGTKQIIDAQWEWSEDEFWARQGEISGPVFTSEDAREGAVAFGEKREPVWKGR